MLSRKLFVLAFMLFVLFVSSAYAGDFQSRGRVVVNGVVANHHSSTKGQNSFLYVTNVSGSDVDCRVTVYDHAGDDVTSYCGVRTGSSTGPGGVVVSDGTGTFSLPAGASRYVVVSVPTANRFILGHAVVEWSSEDTYVKTALIVSGMVYYMNGGSYAERPLSVIGNQPF